MNTDYMLQGSFGRTAYRVNAYEACDVYGGPEEGGWWWTDYSPTGESWGPVHGLDAAWRLRDLLERRAEARNEGRWPQRSSNGGDWYTLLVEDHAPKHQPEERPYYC